MQCKGCPCKYTFNGKDGFFCCITCKTGTPCKPLGDGNYPHGIDDSTTYEKANPLETIILQHKNGNWTLGNTNVSHLQNSSAMMLGASGTSIINCSNRSGKCMYCKDISNKKRSDYDKRCAKREATAMKMEAKRIEDLKIKEEKEKFLSTITLEQIEEMYNKIKFMESELKRLEEIERDYYSIIHKRRGSLY